MNKVHIHIHKSDITIICSHRLEAIINTVQIATETALRMVNKKINDVNLTEIHDAFFSM